MKKEEALEVVKQMIADGIVSQEDVEKYFHALKESEGEKIRKKLIEVLNLDIKGAESQMRNCSGVDRTFEIEACKKGIAWLEKQGTPAKLSEEEQNRFAKGVLKSCAMSFIDYLDAHKCEGKMCVSNGECEDIENAFHNAMWDRLHRYYCKYIEKQGERKAIKVPKFKDGDLIQFNGMGHNRYTIKEVCGMSHYNTCSGRMDMSYTDANFELVEQKLWSEEDEDMLYKATAVINRLCAEGKEYVWSISTLNKLFYWLKSLKNRVQPKQGWNEEDEERIKNILSVLDVQVCWDGATGKKGNPYQKEINWLKSLKDRVQPQLKQEWSEEDEKMIEAALQFAHEYGRHGLWCWLKSLKDRCTWKPSREQIMALRWVLNHIPYDSHKEEISGLLEQLKQQNYE